MSNDRFLKIVDSLILDIHSDYRGEMIGIVEDLRNVFVQPSKLLATKECNLMLLDLEGYITNAEDTGDVLCTLFAVNLLRGDRKSAAQMFSLLVDYSTKDNGAGYIRTMAKLGPFLICE